jgi:stalled ribosome rescue protein Dom34
MSLFHAVIWLDRHSAQILQFDFTQVQAQQVKSHIHYTRQHGSKVRSEHEFFSEICNALAGVSEVIVAGSYAMQSDFRHYVDKQRPQVAKQVVKWQTLDHPSTGELIALARRYFATREGMASLPTSH